MFDLQNGQFRMIQLNTRTMNTLLPVGVQYSMQSPKHRGVSVSIYHFWCDANLRASYLSTHRKLFSD